MSSENEPRDVPAIIFGACFFLSGLAVFLISFFYLPWYILFLPGIFILFGFSMTKMGMNGFPKHSENTRDWFTCDKCGHKWRTRKKKGKPPYCPHCNSKIFSNISKKIRDRKESESFLLKDFVPKL